MLSLGLTMLAGCSNESDSPRHAPHPDPDENVFREVDENVFRDVGVDVRARVIPAGWHVLDTDLSGYRLVAGSFKVKGGGPQTPCRPGRILRQMPPDSALIELSEVSLPALGEKHFRQATRSAPPRSHRFRLGSPRPYECGPSYVLPFRDSGRIMAAAIWTRPHSLGGERRREVLRLLDSLRIGPLLNPRPRSPDQLRAAVIDGARRDFHTSRLDLEELGAPGFERCLLSGIRKQLNAVSLERLRDTYFERGQPLVAQALNRAAAPLADRCGRRQWVPQLVEAAKGVSGYG